MSIEEIQAEVTWTNSSAVCAPLQLLPAITSYEIETTNNETIRINTNLMQIRMEDGRFSIEGNARHVHPTTTGECITICNLCPVSSIHFPHIIVVPPNDSI
jgi:hypothetical protein